jgi:hypothetical protein
MRRAFFLSAIILCSVTSLVTPQEYEAITTAVPLPNTHKSYTMMRTVFSSLVEDPPIVRSTDT